MVVNRVVVKFEYHLTMESVEALYNLVSTVMPNDMHDYLFITVDDSKKHGVMVEALSSDDAFRIRMRLASMRIVMGADSSVEVGPMDVVPVVVRASTLYDVLQAGDIDVDGNLPDIRIYFVLVDGDDKDDTSSLEVLSSSRVVGVFIDSMVKRSEASSANFPFSGVFSDVVYETAPDGSVKRVFAAVAKLDADVFADVSRMIHVSLVYRKYVSNLVNVCVEPYDHDYEYDDDDMFGTIWVNGSVSFNLDDDASGIKVSQLAPCRNGIKRCAAVRSEWLYKVSCIAGREGDIMLVIHDGG